MLQHRGGGHRHHHQGPSAPHDADAPVTQGQLQEELAELRREMLERMAAMLEATEAADNSRSASRSLADGETGAPNRRLPRNWDKYRRPRDEASPGKGAAALAASDLETNGGNAASTIDTCCGANADSQQPSGVPPETASEEPAEVEEIVKVSMDVELDFEESMWDAAVFVGCREIGTLGSLFTFGVLMMNVAVALTMCLIINDSLTQPQFDQETIDDYHNWRTTVAHNVKFVDSITWQSLASRVCMHKEVPLSAGPIAGLSAIAEYRPLQEDRDNRSPPPLGYLLPGKEVGIVACCIALGVWWCTVLKEVFAIVDMGQCLWALPKGKTVITKTSDGFALESVSCHRRLGVGVILMIRAFVCLALLVCGSLYLAYTISLGDLLLNALALEIVLDMDELIFAVFAPISVRRIIRSMAPLAKPRSIGCRGLDVKPVIALVFVAAASVSMVCWVLLPQSTKLDDARDALCGGNRNFVAGVDKTGLVVAFNPNTSRASMDVSSTYVYRAFAALVTDKQEFTRGHLSGSLSEVGVDFSGSRFSVEGMATNNLESATLQTNAACLDMLNEYHGDAEVRRLILEQELSNLSAGTVSVVSCQDAKNFCESETTAGLRARQFCPETCGCDDPASQLVLFSSQHGCPKSCTQKLKYLDKLSEFKCTDWAPQSHRLVGGLDSVQSYLESFTRMGWPSDVITGFTDQINSTLHQSGCAGTVKKMVSSDSGWWLGNLCKEDNNWGFRPLTLICPESCGCVEENALLCPLTCDPDWEEVCLDNDDGLRDDIAAATGNVVGGCADVSFSCSDPDDGDYIMSMCCATCRAAMQAPSLCADDDAGMVAKAATIGEEITGCADVADLCSDPEFGENVSSFCCATCDQGAGGAGAS